MGHSFSCSAVFQPCNRLAAGASARAILATPGLALHVQMFLLEICHDPGLNYG
jgi:hypothetical protein